jgi:AcrR family transcriptional regulator
MTESSSHARRVVERKQQILDAARAAAETDGWAAVTVRRLADAIGYTQPVLYSHFPGGKTEIVRTVALSGFAELTTATRTAMGHKKGARAIAAVAGAYLKFASVHPAMYEAMFELPIDARFAQADAEAELRSGFAALGAALGDGDHATETEVLWGALHGISLLERAGRMRPQDRALRITELAGRFEK